MKSVIHSFDVEDAKLYGVECAVLLYNIKFWCDKNMANDKHEHDGYYWTYNSVNAFTLLFPYLTFKQIRGALERLEKAGAIKSGNHNEKGYDKTKWYTTPNHQKGQMHLPPRANGVAPEGKPIPDINTDINHTVETNVSSISLKAKKVKSKSEFDYKEILNDWSKQTNEYKVFEHYLNYRKIELHSQAEIDRFKKTYYKSASIIKKYSPQRAERVFLALIEKKNQDWSLWNVASEISNKKYE